MNDTKKEIWDRYQNNKEGERASSVLTDFNDTIQFFIGPMYKEIAIMIEKDKASILIDKIFLMFITSIVIFCSFAVSYKMKLYHNQIRDDNTSDTYQ